MVGRGLTAESAWDRQFAFIAAKETSVSYAIQTNPKDQTDAFITESNITVGPVGDRHFAGMDDEKRGVSCVTLSPT